MDLGNFQAANLEGWDELPHNALHLVLLVQYTYVDVQDFRSRRSYITWSSHVSLVR